MRKTVPIRANRFFDPHTESGWPLDEAPVIQPRIHECGVLTIDSRWDYRSVCSPFWRAYHNPSGGGAVRSGGKRYPLDPGSVLIIPEETVYDCVPAVGALHFWIHFSHTDTADSAPRHPLTFRLDATGEAVWKDLAAKAAALPETSESRPALAALCTAALLPLLIPLESTRSRGKHPHWERFLDRVAQDLAHPWTVDSMAAVLGTSRRTFLRWFGAETGTTPAAWLRRRRIREACRLLRFTAASMEHIAEAVGFANRHHFTRAFSAETGTGPAAYRKGLPQVRAEF